MTDTVDMSFDIDEDGEIIVEKVEYPVPFLKFKDYFSVLLINGFYVRSIETEANDYVEDGAMDTMICKDTYNDIIMTESGAVALFDHSNGEYFLYNGVSNIVDVAKAECNLVPNPDAEGYNDSGEYFEGKGFRYLGKELGYILNGGMQINSKDFVACGDAYLSDVKECEFRPTEKYTPYLNLLRRVAGWVCNSLSTGTELSSVEQFYTKVVFENAVGNGYMDEDDDYMSDEFIKYCNYAIVRSNMEV